MDKILYFPAIDEQGEPRTRSLFIPNNTFEKVATGYSDQVQKFINNLQPDLEKYLYMLVHAVGAGEYWGCFLEGTPVLMANGNEMPIEDIEAGDLVTTHTGSNHKVLEPLSKLYDGKIRTFNFRSWGEDLTCTERHPIYGIKGERLREARRPYYKQKISQEEFISDLEYDFIKANELEIGDYVCIPFPAEEKICDELGDNDFAFLMGWYLAEGCLARNYKKSSKPWNRVILTLSPDEDDCVDQIRKACDRLGYAYNTKISSGAYRVEISSKDLVSACLNHLGVGSKNKFLSNDVLSMPSLWKQILLTAYMTGDGCQTHGRDRCHSSLRSSTASRSLASGLCKLAATLGYSATYFKCKQHGTSQFNPGGTIYENSYQKKMSVILNSPKFIKVSSSQSSMNTYIDENRGYILVRVKGIQEDDYSGSVYNLHVEEDNSYVVQNIAVHNSNVNQDFFPESGLKHDGLDYGHKTFERFAKLYKHHVNKDPKRSYGDVLYSHYDDDMHRVLLVIAVDRDKAPDICQKIEVEGQYPDVSMGCKVPYDVCSICHKKAKNTGEYCYHARNEMGKIYPDGRKVYVSNPYPRFFDISQVFIGAEKPAKFLHKISFDSDQFGKNASGLYVPNSYIGMCKAASIGMSMLSADVAEKIGYSVKESEITKEIPSGETGIEPDSENQELVMKGMSRLRNRECDIDDGTLGTMSKCPLKKTLGTLTSMGIALKPGEFQKIILIKMGHTELAEVLGRRNIEFDITDGNIEKIDPITYTYDDIDSDIEKLAFRYLDKRSDLQPHLFNRTMRVLHQEKRASLFEREPSRTNVVPALLGVASLYIAYKAGLLKMMSPVERMVGDAVEVSGLSRLEHPAAVIPIAATVAAVMQGIRGLSSPSGRPDLLANSDKVKLASAKDLRNLAIVSGAMLSPYIAREHIISKARRGEEIGITGKLIYNNPGKLAIGGFLTAPQIAKGVDALLSLRKLGGVKKGNPPGIESIKKWFGKQASDNRIKLLLENVVMNKVWSREKLSNKINYETASSGTILGLAVLGSKEE